MNVPPTDLSPGDLIRSPGGEAVVTEVDLTGSLVRLTFRDGYGPGFAYLPRTQLVTRLDRSPLTP